MNKSLKLFFRLFGSLAAVGLTDAIALEALAQPQSAPAPVKATAYSFFQGLTFPPFPGTIPRPAYGNGNSNAPIFPIVEVPTPGISIAKEQPSTIRRRRRKPRVENSEQPSQPVRRRRRSISKPSQN